MKVIVTGGLGFIGSNIIKFLNKKGIYEILIVDNFNKNNSFSNILGCDFVDLISISDFEENIIKNKYKEFDIILHQGACSDTMEEDGEFVFRNNYRYSKKILEFCLLNNVRLVYASSAAVYGNSENFRELPINENPINIYGFSKLCFDNLVRKNLNKSVQIAGLRYFNVFGPGEDFKDKMSSIVFQLFFQQINENKMNLFGKTKNCLSGEQKRDFIYIEDIINFNWFLITNSQISGIFNAGTGQSNTFNNVAKYVFESIDSFYYKNKLAKTSKFNLKPNINFIEFPSKLIGKYQEYTKADIKNIRNEGFKYVFPPLADSINDYVNYLMKKNNYDL